MAKINAKIKNAKIGIFALFEVGTLSIFKSELYYGISMHLINDKFSVNFCQHFRVYFGLLFIQSNDQSLSFLQVCEIDSNMVSIEMRSLCSVTTNVTLENFRVYFGHRG